MEVQMKKKLMASLSYLSILWMPLAAQDWQHIGPAAPLYHMGLNIYNGVMTKYGAIPYNQMVIQGSLIFIGNSSDRMYYRYDLNERAGWDTIVIPGNYTPDALMPFQYLHANDSAWYTIPMGADPLFRVSKDTSVTRYAPYLTYTWKQVEIPGFGSYAGCGGPPMLDVSGDTLVAGIGGKCIAPGSTCIAALFAIFLSTDNAATWKLATPSKGCNVGMSSLMISRNYIVSSTSNGTLLLDRKSLDTVTYAAPTTFYQIYECGKWFFGIDSKTANNLYRSTDGCKTWSACKSGLTDSIKIASLHSAGGRVFLASLTDGIFLYDTVQNKWTPCNKGLGDGETRIVGLTEYAGSAYALTEKDLYVYALKTRAGDSRRAATLDKQVAAPVRIVFSKATSRLCIMDGRRGMYNCAGRRLAGPAAEIIDGKIR
jgi:hypothetical protein